MGEGMPSGDPNGAAGEVLARWREQMADGAPDAEPAGTGEQAREDVAGAAGAERAMGSEPEPRHARDGVPADPAAPVAEQATAHVVDHNAAGRHVLAALFAPDDAAPTAPPTQATPAAPTQPAAPAPVPVPPRSGEAPSAPTAAPTPAASPRSGEPVRRRTPTRRELRAESRAAERAAARAAEIAPIITPRAPTPTTPPTPPTAIDRPLSARERHPDAAEPRRPSTDVVFPTKRGARVVVGLIVLMLLAGTVLMGLVAYDDRSTTNVGIAIGLGVLTLVIWAARAGSTPAKLAIHSGQLEVTQGRRRDVIDLSSQFTRVETIGRPGRSNWRVLFERIGQEPLVVDRSMVDPHLFTEALERHLPKD